MRFSKCVMQADEKADEKSHRWSTLSQSGASFSVMSPQICHTWRRHLSALHLTAFYNILFISSRISAGTGLKFSMIVLCEFPKGPICVCITAEESVRAIWVDTDDTDTMWSMADVQLFSRWDVVFVNVPCIPGLSPTNTAYYGSTLSLSPSLSFRSHTFTQPPFVTTMGHFLFLCQKGQRSFWIHPVTFKANTTGVSLSPCTCVYM